MRKRGGIEKDWPRLRARIQSAARRLGLTPDDDLLQTIFWQILEGRHQHATAKQMVIDHIRREISREGTENSQVRKALRQAASLEHIYYVRAPDWLGPLITQIDLKRMLDDIPKFYALLVELYHFDGYQFNEIAEFMGCTESNIAIHHRNALALLQKRALKRGKKFEKPKS